jgi:hypothetical protein
MDTYLLTMKLSMAARALDKVVLQHGALMMFGCACQSAPRELPRLKSTLLRHVRKTRNKAESFASLGLGTLSAGGAGLQCNLDRLKEHLESSQSVCNLPPCSSQQRHRDLLALYILHYCRRLGRFVLKFSAL